VVSQSSLHVTTRAPLRQGWRATLSTAPSAFGSFGACQLISDDHPVGAAGGPASLCFFLRAQIRQFQLFCLPKVSAVIYDSRRANALEPNLAKSQTWGSCHKRQKPQAPTPQAPIRNRQTRKVANAKGLNRNTNLT